MLDRLHAMFQRRRDLNEMRDLTDRDLDDLGMTRGQIEDFARLPQDVPDRMRQMAAIFGLTEAQIKQQYDAYLDLTLTCGRCGHRGDCSKTLRHASAATPADASYCPNAAAYAVMAAVDVR